MTDIFNDLTHIFGKKALRYIGQEIQTVRQLGVDYRNHSPF